MTYSIGNGLAVLFLLVPAALTTVWGFLRLLDRTLGRSFRDHLEKLEKNPVALAIYLGARNVGVCLLVAELYSRVV